MTTDDRPVIVHVVHSLEGGGTERMLLALLHALDPTGPRHVVVTLRAAGSLSARLPDQVMCRPLGVAGRSKWSGVRLAAVVRQLRGDMMTRFVEERLTDSGFKYLLENGVVFADAHHPHANTETIVGHVTLATGAYPADHGLVGNIWLDREDGELVYNVEDARYPLLVEGAPVSKGITKLGGYLHIDYNPKYGYEKITDPLSAGDAAPLL